MIIMKRIFILIIIAVILGGVSGKILFSKYENLDNYVFSNDKKVYFLEEGVYSTKKSLENNTKDINPKLVVRDDDKYYVYVGITKNQENAKKIKKMYTDKGYSIYEKEKNITDTEFLNNIEQFDVLVESTKKERDISTIQEVILSNYEEMIINKG